MMEPAEAARSSDFVPTSFEDLRRDTPGDRADLAVDERRVGPQDLGAMIADRGFMQTSKWISIGAVGIGAALILAAYARPLFQTADAVHTAAAVTAVTADKAGGQVQAVQGAADGVARKAAIIKNVDMRAINMAAGGLGCLSGQGRCAGGGSSPFK